MVGGGKACKMAKRKGKVTTSGVTGPAILGGFDINKVSRYDRKLEKAETRGNRSKVGREMGNFDCAALIP